MRIAEALEEERVSARSKIEAHRSKGPNFAPTGDKRRKKLFSSLKAHTRGHRVLVYNHPGVRERENRDGLPETVLYKACRDYWHKKK